MSVSKRLVHVANSSNKNIRIGRWVFPARRIISINGIEDSLKSAFQIYIDKGELFVTGEFKDAVIHLKTVKPKINVDAVLGIPSLPKEILDADEKREERKAELTMKINENTNNRINAESNEQTKISSVQDNKSIKENTHQVDKKYKKEKRINEAHSLHQRRMVDEKTGKNEPIAADEKEDS